MSMFAFGDIVLCQNHGSIETIATEISRAVLFCGIYMKFGGNVSDQYIRVASKDDFALAFEITDSIVDNTATLLFSPQATHVCISDDCVANRHCSNRISTMTSLLEFIVTRADVRKVILNIGVSTLFDISENTKTIMKQDLPFLFHQLYQEDDIRASIHIVK